MSAFACPSTEYVKGLMKIKEKLMHKYALSPQGASDMLKAFVSVTVSDLVLMIPVSLLYFIVKDYMEGHENPGNDVQSAAFPRSDDPGKNCTSDRICIRADSGPRPPS